MLKLFNLIREFYPCALGQHADLPPENLLSICSMISPVEFYDTCSCCVLSTDVLLFLVLLLLLMQLLCVVFSKKKLCRYSQQFSNAGNALWYEWEPVSCHCNPWTLLAILNFNSFRTLYLFSYGERKGALHEFSRGCHFYK